MDVRNSGDIAAVVRSRRKAIGLTQRELAERVGVSRQWVVAVEAGAPTAGVDLVLTALREVGLRVDVYENDSDTLYQAVQEALA
jgi:y4mF family transcriptional regulator